MVSVSPGDEFRDFGTAPVALVTGDTAQLSELFHYFFRSCYYAQNIYHSNTYIKFIFSKKAIKS